MNRDELAEVVMRGEMALRALRGHARDEATFAQLDAVHAALRGLNIEQARLMLQLERTTLEVLEHEKRLQNPNGIVSWNKRGRKPKQPVRP